MLSSISPVGEAARRQRWALTVGAYLVGSALGGALAGGLAGALGRAALGWLSDAAALLVLAVAAAVGLAADLAGRVPSWHRQVDERWLDRYRGWVYGLGFGVQLGAGVATIAPSSLVPLTLVAAAMTRSLVGGAAVGLVFGATRGLPLLLGATTRSAAALRTRLATVERWRRPAALVTRAAHAGVAVAAVAVAVALRTD